MKKSHIYTRGGDNGTTSLIGGNRVKKCSLQLDAYGTIDELSSHIGLLAAMVESKAKDDTDLLQWIQSRLFDAGTHLAMPHTESETSPCAITILHIQKLEKHIDSIDSQLPVLHSFVLPGGCLASAQSHVCRTVCRRAKRLITALAEEVPLSPTLLSFINRLSDFFFVYARFLNKMTGVDEISWEKDCE